MKYKQDHPDVEKLYKGNVRVGTSCTRCRRYRRTCASTSKNMNGNMQTPRRPQSMRDDITDRGSAIAEDTWKKQPHSLQEQDQEMWDNELLAAVTGSPALSSDDSPRVAQVAVQPRPAHTDLGIDFGDMDTAVAKLTFLTRVQGLESELNELRAERAEFNKDRRDWKAKKRDLVAEIHHLREDKRRAREEHWQLQTKVLNLEKDAMEKQNHDMRHTVLEAELRAENQSLASTIEAMKASKKKSKQKNKELKMQIADLELDRMVDDGEDAEASDMPPPDRTARHSTVH